MPLDIRDKGRLWDMLDAGRAVLEFVQGESFEHFVANRMLRSAVERSLEIIGEAARNVTSQAREALPAVPWKSVIGLRNILAHEYGEVRYEILWTVVQKKVPDLIRELESIGIDEPPG